MGDFGGGELARLAASYGTLARERATLILYYNIAHFARAILAEQKKCNIVEPE